VLTDAQKNYVENSEIIESIPERINDAQKINQATSYAVSVS